MAKPKKKSNHDDPKYLPAHLQQLIDLLPLDLPVHQSVVFEQYGRKPEYARRIRKIVSEYGWKIDRIRGTAGANDDQYIRRSDGPVRPKQLRYEVKPEKRLEIYERDGWVCQMCRGDVSEDQDTTQAKCDHKIPADRGGPSKDDNLQTLCLRCNLKKGQACRHCTLATCLGCPYAFPEQFADTIVVQLTQKAVNVLAMIEATEGIPPNVAIVRLLEEQKPASDEE